MKTVVYLATLILNLCTGQGVGVDIATPFEIMGKKVPLLAEMFK